VKGNSILHARAANQAPQLRKLIQRDGVSSRCPLGDEDIAVDLVVGVAFEVQGCGAALFFSRRCRWWWSSSGGSRPDFMIDCTRSPGWREAKVS